MIIDAHTHVHPEKSGFGDKCDASLDNLIRRLDESKVDKAVILPIAPMVSNAFIGQCCSEYPNKLIGFASVNPLDGFQIIEKLEEDVYNYKLKGLKLHPRWQGFSYNDYFKVFRLVQKASQLNIPVLFDAFPYGSSALTNNILLLINDLAVDLPEAKIIIAHMGGYKLFDALMIAKSNNNIFLDISFTPLYFKDSSIEKDVFFAIKKLGSNRCIYGSDHPQIDLAESLNLARENFDKYSFSIREREDVFCNTIASLLNL